MPRLRQALARLLALTGRGHADSNFAEELECHLALLEQDLRARGIAPDDARRQACLRMGGIARTTHAVRDARLATLVDQLWQEWRAAIRTLRRAPAFTLTTVLTLGLTFGGAMAAFTLVNAVLLRPLPYPDPVPLRVGRGFSTAEAGTRSPYPPCRHDGRARADHQSAPGLYVPITQVSQALLLMVHEFALVRWLVRADDGALRRRIDPGEPRHLRSDCDQRQRAPAGHQADCCVSLGCQPFDPPTLLFAAATLGVVSAAAIQLPAVRAARVTPAHVLRQ